MLENIISGPICSFKDEKDKQDRITDFFNAGWLPIATLIRGEFFDQLVSSAPLERRPYIKGIIIFFGYKQIPTE